MVNQYQLTAEDDSMWDHSQALHGHRNLRVLIKSFDHDILAGGVRSKGKSEHHAYPAWLFRSNTALNLTPGSLHVIPNEVQKPSNDPN